MRQGEHVERFENLQEVTVKGPLNYDLVRSEEFTAGIRHRFG